MQKPLTYTKNQLIKKLKEDNNYNVEFVKELDVYSQYIWKRGGYDDLRDHYYTDKGYNAQYDKISDIISEVLIGLDARYDRVAKTEALDNLYCDINYSSKIENKKAVKALVSECFGEMTPEDIRNIYLDDIDYTTDAEEYISISVGASVWTYYVSGSITTLGKTFSAKNISYDREANRL